MTRSPNEELVREGFRAFSEGRYEDSLALMDPEIEWHIAFRIPDLPPDTAVVRGHQEIRELWGRFTEAWDSLTFDPEQILYDDRERVIVRIQVHGVGAGSGVEVDRTIFYASTVRDGKLLRILPFDTPAAAAEHLGVDPARLA